MWWKKIQKLSILSLIHWLKYLNTSGLYIENTIPNIGFVPAD